MKKIILLFSLTGLFFSCEKNDLQEVETNPVSTERITQINSYKSYEDFMEAYSQYAKTDTETLEEISFYKIEDDNLEYSPALQAILNDDHQVIIDNKLILFKEGKFYEVDNDGNKNPKEIGGVTTNKISSTINQIDTKGTVAISNQWAFNKQRHQINCNPGGPIEGPSPRRFKYVHEAYAQEMWIGLFYQYELYLRVKLEYNSTGSRWRLSGEIREININLSNSSYLLDNAGRPIIQNFNIPRVIGNISFNGSCASHQTILLTEYTGLVAPVSTIGWDVTVNGTITEKMKGDIEANRWTDQVNW